MCAILLLLLLSLQKDGGIGIFYYYYILIIIIYCLPLYFLLLSIIRPTSFSFITIISTKNFYLLFLLAEICPTFSFTSTISANTSVYYYYHY